MNSLEQSPTDNINTQFENNDMKEDKGLLNSEGQGNSKNQDPNVVEANQKISLSLDGEAPNFNLKEAKVKEKVKIPFSFSNQSKKKEKKKSNIAKIDKLLLREVKDDYLKISVLLNDNKKEGEVSEKESLKLNNDIKNINDLSNLINEKKKDLANIKVKKRNKFLRKLFGRGKEERDYIEKQQEIQREELRNKLNQVFANDKKEEEKERSIKERTEALQENLNLTNEGISITPSTNDFQSELSNLYTQEEAMDSFLSNRKKQLVFAFKNDIENLENNWGEFSLVLGKNILPFKQRRKKAKLEEPKEELSEIDKLYLSAFSDISIPEDDIDLDDNEFFVNDPLEVEELYNLADESLSNDMESAILCQLNSLKQDIENLESEGANNVTSKAEAKVENNIDKKAFSNPIKEVKEKKNFDNKKNLKLRITNKVTKTEVVKSARKRGSSFIQENFFVRCSSFIIDSIFVVCFCVFLSLYKVVLKTGSYASVFNDPMYLLEFLSLSMKTVIVGFLIYYVLFYTFFQTSFGLAVLSYKIRSQDDSKPRIRQLLVRILCMPLNLLSFSGLFGSQSLQGKISKTKLVKDV